MPNSPLDTIVRQFTPNWFTVTMGTGMLALALNLAPFVTPALHRIAMGLWLLNIGLFVLFAVLYALRWAIFPHEARRIFGHSVASMFFGAIPMALATIINGIVVFAVPVLGAPAVALAAGLWQLDAVLAVACGIGVPFLMFTRQHHSIENMTAVWLLPLVAAEVAAASAGILLPHIADPAAALRLVFLGYALWAFSVPLALGMLVILLLRLVLHKLPHRDMAASGWLSLGPLGTGAMGLLLLGANAPPVLAANGLGAVGPVATGFGIIGATILLGYGAWWLLFALLSTFRYLRDGLPFNLGWWAFTFPLGTYTIGLLLLARQTRLEFLTGVGSVLVCCLALLWLVVTARTLGGAWRRTLFVSPCLVKGSIPSDLDSSFV